MTSIDVEFPPVPQLSSADEIQVRRALRRNRLLATGLLALMIVIAIATRFVPSPGWLVQLVRAGAEAGIIGGLADWFAITVLFRHPFGIPLPHTAILPSNKDRIGRSLGSFVERNFLVPEVILPKMHQADLTGKIAGWLALPETAPMVSDWIITLLNRLLAASHTAQINEFIQHTVGQQLRALDLAPPLGRVIEVLTTSPESAFYLKKSSTRPKAGSRQTGLRSMRWWNNVAVGGFLKPSIAASRLPSWMARLMFCNVCGNVTAKFACSCGRQLQTWSTI
jgi:hypothetical protein